MVEALLLSVIQKLEKVKHRRRPNWKERYRKFKEFTNDLRKILDFLNKNGGQRSNLKYLIADLEDIAKTLNEIMDNINGTVYSFHLFPKIQPYHGWVKEINMRMLKFGADGAEAAEIVREEDEDEEVVGLEKDVELLGGVIFHEKQGFQTLLIKGMVAIGKTTLARQVYNHAAVIDRFDRRAWVCVSTDLSYKEILMKLIQQVVDSEELQRDSLMEKMERADNKSLQQMLHQQLQGNQYFIVLDDLPKEMRSNSIRKALPQEGKGSILLITSRSQHKEITFSYTHEMKTLDSHTSWQLFLKTIFRGDKFTSESEFPKKLEKRARGMLKKCYGLPLAIKEMGRQVAKKRRSGSTWEQLVESIDLGATLELLEKRLYHKMNPRLKSSFLHLAFFKENTTIRTQKLKTIWAAGGIVTKYSTTSYLEELISESIIEVQGNKKSREKSCFLNGILHMLSTKKAEEEIGFEILGKDGNNRPSQCPRHRVINVSRNKFNYSTNQDKHLVSLFFHGGGYLDASPSYWKGFEELKILDLDDFGLKVLPESIGTLIKLEYLGLRNNYLQKLPHSLACLTKLEVLDIALNFMVEVPDIIWEMSSLCCIYMSDVICRKPLKMDALQSLTTLAYISVDNWIYELSGLRMMKNLKKVGIDQVDGNSDVSNLFASLADLISIDHLILRGFRFTSMPCLDGLGLLEYLPELKLDGRLSRLPSAGNFPPNLTDLTLVNSCLDEDPMPVLEKLPHLIYLKLRNVYTGQQMVILGGGFPKLKDLCMEELWNLRNLQVGEGAMPLLKILEIKNCPYLETLPEDIMSMTRPKELKDDDNQKRQQRFGRLLRCVMSFNYLIFGILIVILLFYFIVLG